MADRGFKKRLPFDSLVEQKKYLDKMIYEKYKIEKPMVFKEQAEKINRILSSYVFNEPLCLTIYHDGYVYNVKTSIKLIDKVNKVIYFSDYVVPIRNILDIEETDIVNLIC